MAIIESNLGIKTWFIDTNYDSEVYKQTRNVNDRLTTIGWDTVRGLIEAVVWIHTKGRLEQWGLKAENPLVRLCR